MTQDKSTKISFIEDLEQIKALYLETKQELEVLAKKLKEIPDNSKATLAVFREAEAVQPFRNQEPKEVRNEQESAEALLDESSRYIIGIEEVVDDLIKQAEEKGAMGIVDEAKNARKKFRNRILKFSAIFLLAFAQQASELKIPTETFSEKDEARVELQTKGITSFQKRRYIPGVSEAIFRGVKPIDYNQSYKIINFLPNFIKGEGGSELDNVATTLEGLSGDFAVIGHNRTDAWRLYLGLPQKHNTFGISDFKPAKSTDNKYYFKINNFLEANTMTGTAVGMKPVETLLSHINSVKTQKIVSEDLNFIMGNYTLSKGEDEKGSYISYYDRWELGPTIEGQDGLIGQPFEIYDRIYYDPETFEVIEHQQLDVKNLKVTITK